MKRGGYLRKLSVYLDTSVISYLQQEDSPERMSDTNRLWNKFEKNEFRIFLSQVTLNEVEHCPEPKRSLLYEYLSKIDYEVLRINEEVIKLARRIIDMGILTSKSFEDCQHIAVAVINNCDCIISWNFKHIVNIKTIRGVRAITNLEGYKCIDIINPSVLLESEV